MKTLLVVLTFLVCGTETPWASIPQSSGISQIEKILVQKTDQKYAELKKMGPHVYRELRRISFDKNKTLGLRWYAFMAMVRLGAKESLPEVHLALGSRDWFMRDAALKVLPLLDQERAYLAAIDKLNDTALVVRTSAVDTLKKLRRSDCTSELWKELYSRENYIKNQSLWIRRHIVEALAEVAPAGNEGRFLKVLDDIDSSLYGPAIHGLERLTGKKLGEANVPPMYRRYYWKKWFKDAEALNKVPPKKSS